MITFEALETIGAFANAQGGTLFIGVANNGHTVGISVGTKTLEDMANRIQEATDPRIQPSISQIDYDNKTIVAIVVKPTILAPVNIRGRYFCRVGKTNQRMGNDEIMQRMRVSIGFSWDSCIETNATLYDLNSESIYKFVRRVKNTGRHPVPEDASEMDLLRKIKLIIDDRPTRASLLLFGNDPEKYSNSAFIKLGRFRSPTHIVDDREIHGTLLEQLDGTMAWFRERLETEFIITGNPQREVIWEYPLDAIREAVVNLLCHRDYTSNAHSQIRLYDERVEFWNAGALPMGLTPEMLFTEHNSIRRNISIAEAFFYMGLIERWGSGTTRMAEELQAYKHPLPKFESDGFKFKVSFYRSISTDDNAIPLTVGPQNLTERQSKALDYIKQYGSITNAKYCEIANVSKDTAKRDLKWLITQNVLIQEGSGRTTRYRLK
jgi:ATP-dependent DNA helicase RecG